MAAMGRVARTDPPAMMVPYSTWYGPFIVANPTERRYIWSDDVAISGHKKSFQHADMAQKAAPIYLGGQYISSSSE